MNKIGIMCLGILLSIGLFSQQLKIPIAEKTGFGFCLPAETHSYSVPDVTLYSGYDSTKYKKIYVKRIIFDYIVEDVEEFILQNRHRDKAMAWIQKFQRDTSYVLYQKMPKNSAAYLYGIDKENFVHFIMDANNNQRFDDDREYIFDTSSSITQYPIIHVRFEYYDGKKIQEHSVPYRINVYTSRLGGSFVIGPDNKEIIAPIDDVEILKFSYKEGRYEDGKTKILFQINADNIGIYNGLYNKQPFRLSFRHINSTGIAENRHPMIFRSTDTLEFDYGRYRVDSMVHDTLYLFQIEKSKYDAARMGSLAYEIKSRDITNGQFFSLEKNRGKYIAINFWGSWCEPCIKELPELKALHKKYPNVVFVSVAKEQSEDVSKLKALITENKLSWTQLYINSNLTKPGKGIIWDYKIAEYPTTILVGPTGKIIIREVGAKALREIDKFLSKNPL